MLINSIKRINIKNQIKKLTPCDVLFFCHDNDYGLSLRGKVYSPLIDSIREELELRGWKTQTIGHPFSKIEGDAAWSKPILFNRSFLIARIKDKIYGLKLFSMPFKRKNTNTFTLYGEILKQSDPGCIITIGTLPDLCQAAKESNISCIELLHGVGYKKIPWGYDKRNQSQLPDGILSLDSSSTKIFRKLEHVNVRQIPHPFFKRFQAGDRQKLPVEWKSNNVIYEDKKIILISLQWGYDTYSQFIGILKNHIMSENLIAAIKSTLGRNIIWAFRLHPVQLRDKAYKHHLDFIKEFCNTHINAEWEWFTEMPLPVVLRQCAGHITMSSMTSYEAAYMGVKTLALCPTLQQGGYNQGVFSDLEQAGYLIKTQADAKKIVVWAEGVMPTQPFLENLADEEAWEQAIEWMLGSRRKDRKEMA